MTVTTPAVTPGLPAERRAPKSPRRPSFSDREYWVGVRYLAFGRAVPTALFGFLGWIQLQRVLSVLPETDFEYAFTTVLPRLLYLTFCCLPVVIYLTRPRPTASDGRLIARVAAFGGTLTLLLLPVYTPSSAPLFTTPTWFASLSGVMLAGAWTFAIWSLSYLRRSLSVIPEARRLTTSGPYRLVRHPLYFAEISAAIAVQLTNLRLFPVLALGMFIGLQLTRAHFEERLLRRAFPEYVAYTARTRRIVPFLL